MDFKKFFPTVVAQAHCDIPCGIYDPTPAKIAAKTVARMTDQITAFQLPENWTDRHAVETYVSAVSRRIKTKEEHAEACKKELQVLWSDFFKPEHVEKFPHLHDMFWKALKLASKTKQEVDKETASQLTVAVDEIAKIFYEVKGDPARYESYKNVTDKLY